MCKSAIFVCLFFVAVTAEDARIVGGDFAKENEFPYQVSVQRDGSHYCGGSIITQNFILTAAHCVTDDPGTPPLSVDIFQVLAGTTNLTSGGVRRNVTNITVHEDYGNFQNDIALIQLSEPLTYDESIKNISLRTTELRINSKVVISGWGRIYTNGPLSNDLKFNTERKGSGMACRLILGGIYYDGLLCLIHSQNNGACNGDSGGPATYKEELVGVANFVINGCGSMYPDGYAKVSYFVDWIRPKVY